MAHPTISDRDILSPRGVPAAVPVVPAAPRPATLAGRRVGLLDNSKKNADVFLDEIALLLAADGVTDLRRVRKPAAAMPLGSPALAELESCGAVVSAFGDCGSCTSWCIHDSVELERRGIPVATINSSEFAPLGRREARALGMPMLPIAVVGHPIGSIAEHLVRERARAVYPRIVLSLTEAGAAPAEEPESAAACAIAPMPAEDCGCAA